MTYEQKSGSLLERVMATKTGRDAYLKNFQDISTPANGWQHGEMAAAYKLLWQKGVEFPTRKQLFQFLNTDTINSLSY